MHDDIKAELFQSIDCLRSDKPTGLLLMGEVGCGKTSILNIIFESHLQTVKSEILNKYSKSALQILPDNNIYIKESDRMRVLNPVTWASIGYYTHWQLLRILRECYDSEDTLDWRRWRQGGDFILLIDDFGAAYEDRSGWNLSLQDEFFDNRWKRKLPTFITTNFDGPRLRSMEGWERIVDRIADPSWITAVNVPGGSRRKADEKNR